jgi:hypothetical protein
VLLAASGLAGVAETTVSFCDQDSVYATLGVIVPVRLPGTADRSKVMLIVALNETLVAPSAGLVLATKGGFVRQGQPPIQRTPSAARHTRHC